MGKIVQNEIALVRPKHNMSANACNALALNEGVDIGQYVPFDIVHTLGGDKDVQAFSATVGDDTGSASVLGQIATFNLVGDGTSATGAVVEWRDSPSVIVPSGTTYKIVLDVVVASGAFTPNQFRYGELTVNVDSIGLIVNNQYTASFTHTFEFTTGNQASLSQPIFFSRNNIAGSYTVEIQSIEQITNPNSFLTLQDKATETHQTLGNSVDGGSSEEINTDVNILDIANWVTNGAIESGLINLTINQYAVYYVNPNVSASSAYVNVQGTGKCILRLDTGVYSNEVTLPFSGVISVSIGIISRIQAQATSGGCTITSYSAKLVLPISTKYNQDKSCANIFATDVPVTDADRVLMNADKLAVFKLVKGDLTTGLSFGASNVKNLWLGNNIGTYEQDLMVDLGIDVATGKSSWTPYGTNTVAPITDGITITIPIDGDKNGAYYNPHIYEVNKIYVITLNYDFRASSEITLEVTPLVSTSSLSGSGTIAIMIRATKTNPAIRLTNAILDNDYSIIIESIREATATEIKEYTDNCRDFFKNENDGVNQFKLDIDPTGRALDYLGDDVMAFANGDGRNLPMGLYLNLPRYRVVEPVSGLMQNFGSDIIGALDFTNWLVANANATINDSDTYTTSASLSGIFKTGLDLIEGETYLIHIEGTTTSTNLDIVDGGLNISSNIHDGGGDFRVDIEIVWDSSNLNLMLWNVTSGTTTITEMTVKELTTKTQRKEYRVLERDKNVEGSEQLTNWNFETDLTDWGGATRGVLEWQNSMAKFTVDAIEASGYFAHQINSVDTSIGKWQIAFEVDIGTATQVDFRERGGATQISFYKSGKYYIDVISNIDVQPIITFFGKGTIGYVKSVSVKEITEVNKLYINGVLDTTSPALPDPSVVLTQMDKALIGYGDTITRRYKPFSVSSGTKTAQEELDEYNAWLLLNP